MPKVNCPRPMKELKAKSFATMKNVLTIRYHNLEKPINNVYFFPLN